MITVRQLVVISLFVATASAVRVGINWIALAVSIPIYGIILKIGLTEILTFAVGFAFGPVQGFLTGALIIIVSDLFTLAGIWTPFIAIIIGMIGLLGGILRRFKHDPSVLFFGATALTLTVVSELLQNIWFAWYMWAFYMPEATFLVVLTMSIVGGIPSIVMAIINNVILFTAVSPRIIKILNEQIKLKTG